MTEDEERYVHLYHCLEDMNGAWNILQELKEHRATGVLAQAAFRYALVEYAKPYKTSRGIVTSSHSLGDNHVPRQHLDLHRDLIRARDQIHAHSDLSVRDAKVRVRDTDEGKIVTHVRKGVDVAEEYRRIDSILDLVELTIERLHGELEKLGQSLPANGRPT